jgi:DNA-binding transcriptional regulator YiaG
MTSLGSVLRNEITRLSRKEARVQVEPLRKANATYRRDIAALKRQVALLQRQVAVSSRARPRPAETNAETKPTRFVAKGLRSLRTRLGLSAADFAKLAGVSAQSIYNWETGKAVPRPNQMTALAGLRALGKKEAQARLLAPASKASKKKK